MYGNSMSARQREESLKAYQNKSLKEAMAMADPYTITKMLFQGLFERLCQAKGAILRGDMNAKSKKLSAAGLIIENLRNSLDFSYRKDFAQNMYDLYTYMIGRLADANMHATTEPIDAVIKTLLPIKNAWDNIPYAAVQEAAKHRSRENTYEDHALANGSI